MDFIYWLENIFGMSRGAFYQLSSSDQDDIYNEYDEFKEEHDL